MYIGCGTPNKDLGGGGLILAYSSINLCKARFYAIVHALSINTRTDTMSKRINNKRGAGNPRQTKTIKLRRERNRTKAKAEAKEREATVRETYKTWRAANVCEYCDSVLCKVSPEGIPGCGLGADKYC
jgi:hypothetical protein